MAVREATEADLDLVMELTAELARFEELEHEVVATPEQFHAALFGPDRVPRVSICENDEGEAVGHALWFPTFSTFLGTTGIWLEDLFVRPAHRGQGYATELLVHLRSLTSGRVEWEVLDWNDGAATFYDGLGAKPHTGWTKYRWLPS